MATNIYLDESGDLGWSFDNPYKGGGSSRYLTIAFVICPAEKAIVIKRLVKKIYKHFKHDPTIELKASDMGQAEKCYIAERVKSLLDRHSDIRIGAITVKKQNVLPHIRLDSNKLYNYMLRLAVLNKISNAPEVHLIRDNRSIKVKYGSCLIDYLQTVLWFDMASETKIYDHPSDSKAVRNLVFIDWINNIIWGHYEFGKSAPYMILRNSITETRLFFH